MLQATVGQFADPRHLQLEIVPRDSVLWAELFVATRAIGFVRPGQTVRSMYEAFPPGRGVETRDDDHLLARPRHSAGQGKQCGQKKTVNCLASATTAQVPLSAQKQISASARLR